jgi:hypothetical protein
MTKDTQELLIVLPSIVLILGIVWAWFSYFPKVVSSNFRIREKRVGKYEYFQAQVKRPIFGWSAFYASISDGTINRVGDWDRDKSEAEQDIRKYQDLRPLGLED